MSRLGDDVEQGGEGESADFLLNKMYVYGSYEEGVEVVPLLQLKCMCMYMCVHFDFHFHGFCAPKFAVATIIYVLCVHTECLNIRG